jgi:hypothetical protein
MIGIAHALGIKCHRPRGGSVPFLENLESRLQFR